MDLNTHFMIFFFFEQATLTKCNLNGNCYLKMVGRRYVVMSLRSTCGTHNKPRFKLKPRLLLLSCG